MLININIRNFYKQLFTLINMLFQNPKLKILTIFFQNPNETFTIRGLAKKTKISPAWVSKKALELKKEGLIVKDKTNRVRANLESKDYYKIKSLYNLNNLFESGLINYLNQKYIEPECIILFGSYAKGEDIKKSDIDIAIITKKQKQINLTKYEKILRKKINIHEIKIEKTSKEFKNTLANGIIMSGYLNIIQ